jgi:hypothetical protein
VGDTVVPPAVGGACTAKSLPRSGTHSKPKGPKELIFAGPANGVPRNMISVGMCSTTEPRLEAMLEPDGGVALTQALETGCKEPHSTEDYPS